MPKRLLLLSNSTLLGQNYLQCWKSKIDKLFKELSIKSAVFVPFAEVTISWDDYTQKVTQALSPYQIIGLHKVDCQCEAINQTNAIIVGGGNTFHLLFYLQKNNLLDLIKSKVEKGLLLYIGWSAGCNVACPDIATTNDMPIIWPLSGQALDIFWYNINPHYNNWTPSGLNAESRDDRLKERLLVNPRPIVALPEGMGILVTDHSAVLIKGVTPEQVDLKCLLWRVSDEKSVTTIELKAGQILP